MGAESRVTCADTDLMWWPSGQLKKWNAVAPLMSKIALGDGGYPTSGTTDVDDETRRTQD